MKLANAEVPVCEKRLGIERRKFWYSAYIPERRSGIDRRMATLDACNLSQQAPTFDKRIVPVAGAFQESFKITHYQTISPVGPPLSFSFATGAEHRDPHRLLCGKKSGNV